MFYVRYDEFYPSDDGDELDIGDATIEFDTLDEALAFINEHPDCNPELLD